VHRPRLPPSDRVFWSWLSRLWSGWHEALAFVQPRTVIVWQRQRHPKGIEVFRDKPILYGCGDLLNDYEGIKGYEAFRDDLTLMYFVAMEPNNGTLQHLTMMPMQLKRLRLHRAPTAEAQWLLDMLTREGGKFGARAVWHEDQTLTLQWRSGNSNGALVLQ
jgi:hypothetical protein